MKVKLLNKDNIKELKDKEILIFFSSDLGAMGCPGLNFIVFNDGSVYAYSKEMDDYELINEDVLELLFNNSEKNVSFIDEYLGMGNMAYINKKIYDEYKRLIKDYRYPAFRELVKKYSKYDINNINNFVEKQLKKYNLSKK